jgi:hypothetical protein
VLRRFLACLAPIAALACSSDGGGAAGLSALVNVTEEPNGANCRTGGQRIETGLDLDRDGTLQASEVRTTNRHPEIDPTMDVDADPSPEGSVFVSAADRPTGKPLLIAGNEVSSTTSVYEITVNP